ncbi:MAG: hypothetical protein CVU95_04080 [Firmicutes bacterium HGW-Firmicutes-2]|nr:MAG: hypothetical protein CVU95_04080 [Firmicutes bacterium HGW-Firmicutes-2]
MQENKLTTNLQGISSSYDKLIFNEQGKDTNEAMDDKDRQGKYINALNTIRELLTKNDTAELIHSIDDDQAKKIVKKKILDYLKHEELNVEGFSDPTKLAEELYKDITGLSFLEKYLERDDVEEIDGNAWDDIEIITLKGWEKIEDKFQSKHHAIDIVRKMVELGGKNLNNKTPQVDSFLGTGLRISAAISPIVDEEVGIIFSIRKQRMKVFSREDFMEIGTCQEEEYDLIKCLLSNGMSIGIGGETNSGKTAFMQSILYDIAKEGKDRICTMEEDTREISLIYKDQDKKKTISRVIHTKTRPSEDEKRNVSPDDILKLLLRFNPNIIAPAEMRGKEAMTAQESARTGHAVITSFHAEDVTGGYFRMLTMCMMSGTNLSEDLLLGLLVRAFPFMVIIEQLPDRTRKVTKIFEATGYEAREKKIKGRLLYQYKVMGKEVDETGRITKIIGKHEKVHHITDKTAAKLFNKGVGIDTIRRFAGEAWSRESVELQKVMDDFIFE